MIEFAAVMVVTLTLVVAVTYFALYGHDMIMSIVH